MAGLRNLIFSLGLKNTRQNQDESDRSEEVPTPVESPRQRAAAAHSYIPVERAPVQHVPDRADSGNGSPTLVTAPPEFLPPKPMVEHTGEGHSKGPSSTAQRDRRDTYDDVEILPSWRGQYRRR
jgi:hypothetical protein